MTFPAEWKDRDSLVYSLFSCVLGGAKTFGCWQAPKQPVVGHLGRCLMG